MIDLAENLTPEMKAICEKLKSCTKDREILHNLLVPLVQNTFTEALKALRTALPQTDPNSERAFQILRKQILDVGNAQLRQLPCLLADFYVEQMLTRTVTVRSVDRSDIANWAASEVLKSGARTQGA